MKRVALITGGTSGIGFATAQALLPDYDLALAYRSDETKAHAAETALRDLAREVRPDSRIEVIGGETMNFETAGQLVSETRTRLGEISALVCSAGRLRDGLFMGSEFSDHEAILNEHLVVPMALAQLVLKSMSRERFGRIVLMSSISARFAKRGQTSYAAAKAGIEGFVKTLALEVAHRGITVNAVAPGLIATPMTNAFIEKMESTGEKLRDRVPAGRVGEAKEVAGLIRYLCLADAAFVTGTVMTIDGGRSLGDPRS